MRIIHFVLLVLISAGLIACQERNPAQPTAPAPETEAVVMPTQPPATAEQPVGQETANEAVKGRDKGELFNLTPEDVLALLNGRFLLTTFMTQSEGISVPLAEAWQLEKVEAGEGGKRIFTFSSDGWTLLLREPAPDLLGLLYYAEISGPDLPRYTAEILVDGSINPAQ